MKKVILINLLISILVISCSSSSVEYLPTVVYLKAPEMIVIDNQEQLQIEFAVSDLNELEGNININIKDESGNSIFEKTLDKLLFSTDGTVISLTEKNLTLTGKNSIEFKVCNIDKQCREQKFSDIELNTSLETDKVTIEGNLLSDSNNFAISIFLSSLNDTFKPNKDDGKFEITDIDANTYNLYTKGDDLKSGFYRYIYLKSLKFNKSTKIYLQIPIEENEEYDEPLLNCSFSSKSDSYSFMILLLVLAFILKFRIRERRKY